MRYSNADRMIKLCHELQATRMGLTLDDIQDRFRVGLRTAQRMKNAVLELYHQTEEFYDDERRKRWRIPQTVATPVGEVTADELADLEFAIRALRKQNDRRRAKSIENLVTKVKGQLNQKAARRIEPDLEVLLEAEGLAMRPGPRPIIRDEIVETLRRAIKEGNEVYIVHRNRERGSSTGRVIHPYGFLFGNRNYLVGTSPEKHPGEPRLYGLPEIQKVAIREKPFVRMPGFSLKTFSERSFGVWQEAPREVAWHFSAKSAPLAQEYMFHPTQQLEQQKDGSLVVRFRAGGLLEMSWHLHTWGDEVEVLSPPDLRDILAGRATLPLYGLGKMAVKRCKKA